MTKLLTKSKFMTGLQCPKCLWTVFNRPELIPEPDEATQRIFDQGTKVGILAQSLFSGGVDAQVEDFMESINKSKELLKEKKPLFEPGFMVNNCYARADILVPVDEGWDIVEVKMGTRVKEENVYDVAFQKYVYSLAGLKINRCFLMHINNEYVKQGEIDASKLFVKEDITESVESIKDIKGRVEEMFKVISLPESPKMKIGQHCKSPYDCDLKEECFKDLHESNIFCLYRGGQKCFDLVEMDILDMKDIPDDFKLTTNQQIQRKCAKTGEVHVNKERLKEWISGLEYPLYFLDFESYQTAIPIYDGTRPYQQICFQFSLHVQEKAGGELKHISFLAEGKENPMKEFIAKLKECLGTSGSIIVYNQSFEKARIKECVEMFPEFKAWSEVVLKRIVDLLVPFRNFWYYNPIQKGSASIKKVLPAVTGKSYEGLEIADGGDASLQYLNITHGENISDEEVKRVRDALESYCGLDTEGEVWILDRLKDIVKK
ncbi:DUF2779 domain-containing protein [Thermoproteota archaeon]